jgi:hypothetical protein
VLAAAVGFVSTGSDSTRTPRVRNFIAELSARAGLLSWTSSFAALPFFLTLR